MNKYEFNSKLFSNKEIKKITSAETIDAKDEYLVIKTTKNQEIQKIRNFSTEQKTKIVVEILESEKMLAEISKQYEVTSKTL